MARLPPLGAGSHRPRLRCLATPLPPIGPSPQSARPLSVRPITARPPLFRVSLSALVPLPRAPRSFGQSDRASLFRVCLSALPLPSLNARPIRTRRWAGSEPRTFRSSDGNATTTPPGPHRILWPLWMTCCRCRHSGKYSRRLQVPEIYFLCSADTPEVR